MAALVAAALHARMRREGEKGEGIKPNKPSFPFSFPPWILARLCPQDCWP